MKRILAFIKTTLIAGFLLVIPFILIIYLFEKVLLTFRRIVAPLADQIHVSLMGGETTARLIVLALLVFVCFIAGFLAKSKRANKFRDYIEDNILDNIPGYTLLKGMSESAAGLESSRLKEVVLVDVEEVWQLGFLMDRIDDDLNVVFIPGAPNPMAGDVVIVKWDRLKKLDLNGMQVMSLTRKLGSHSKKILQDHIDKYSFKQ